MEGGERLCGIELTMLPIVGYIKIQRIKENLDRRRNDAVQKELQSPRRSVAGLHSRGQIHHHPPLLESGPHNPAIPKGVNTPRHSHECVAYALIALTTPVRFLHVPTTVNLPTPSWPSPYICTRSELKPATASASVPTERSSRCIGG